MPSPTNTGEKTDVENDSRPDLVIITGLSGSGKGTVLRVFEDLGFFSVDNLPIELIPKFAQLTQDSGNRAAIVIDIREGEALSFFPELYLKLKHKLNATLVFLEAQEESLVRRFSETRRPHPLGSEVPVLDGLRVERDALEPIRALADDVIDTSRFTVHELRDLIRAKYGESCDESKQLLV